MTPTHSLLLLIAWSALLLPRTTAGATTTLGKRSSPPPGHHHHHLPQEEEEEVGSSSHNNNLRDLLTSIDDRLRVLDATGSTLLRLDFALDQLSRRVENVESKLDRLDAKLEQGGGFSSDAYLAQHLDVKLERLDAKLDSLDRDLDDLLERTTRGEERCARRDEVGERVLAVSGGLVRRLEQMDGAAQRGANRTEAVLNGMERHLAEASDRILSSLLDSHSKIDNLTSMAFAAQQRGGRVAVGGVVELENLTAVLDRALSGHDAKFKELDSDVETYTRKVVHGVQELWKTSDELRSELSLTLEQGGKTREAVRQEFRRMREQVSPLSALTEELARQVSELSQTVDASFATLLVAQNAFIDSCRRVQHEEMHVYDVLQQVVYEMRNRSAEDVRQIGEQLGNHAADLDRALARAVADMRHECAIGRGRPLTSPNDDDPSGGGNRTLDDDPLYDFESEVPAGNLSEYEDYQPYFPESI